MSVVRKFPRNRTRNVRASINTCRQRERENMFYFKQVVTLEAMCEMLNGVKKCQRAKSTATSLNDNDISYLAAFPLHLELSKT